MQGSGKPRRDTVFGGKVGAASSNNPMPEKSIEVGGGVTAGAADIIIEEDDVNEDNKKGASNHNAAKAAFQRKPTNLGGAAPAVGLN